MNINKRADPKLEKLFITPLNYTQWKINLSATSREKIVSAFADYYVGQHVTSFQHL